VRRFLAAVLLVLFASLNAIDGICCPDGCTYEQSASAHGTESGDGLCVLCLGGVTAPVHQEPTPAGIVSDRAAPSDRAHVPDAPADPVERPPRS